MRTMLVRKGKGGGKPTAKRGPETTPSFTSSAEEGNRLLCEKSSGAGSKKNDF